MTLQIKCSKYGELEVVNKSGKLNQILVIMNNCHIASLKCQNICILSDSVHFLTEAFI